jgi:hypothetical protein
MAEKNVSSSIGARRAMEFLEASDLINLDLPLRDTVGQIRGLEEIAGYVLIWERYAVVVAAEEIMGAIDPPRRGPSLSQ